MSVPGQRTVAWATQEETPRDEPLLSAQWFRVATLRPSLDAQLGVERVSYRRQIWHVLVRADGTRSFRINAAGWAFVGRCNGQRSVAQIWDSLVAEQRDDAATQDELIRLLYALHQAGLLTFDRRPDFGMRGVADRSAEIEPQRMQSLLALRIPFGRPDAWLARFAPRLAWLFSGAMAAVWAQVVGAGLLAALAHAEELGAALSEGLQRPQVLVLAWFAYPVIKALHEFAHALAVKRFGGVVPEWGLSILMFAPVPYVDASAATGFARPRDRMAVSLAGIAVELFLAALALGIVLQAQPGHVRDLALAVFFIGSLSTLLVNGNPLLRFDGYHAFCDAMQLPNLATRSSRHWRAWLGTRLLGLPADAQLQPAPGERTWLWLYAPAALAYRVGLSVALVLAAGGLSFMLGLSLACYFAWTIAVQPLSAGWTALRGTRYAEAQRRQATLRSVAIAALLFALIAVVPLPSSSIAQGVVWPGDKALVRNGSDGFIVQVHRHDGERVKAGDLLLSLDSPSLRADQARLAAQLTGFDAQRFAALRSDPEQAAALEEQAAQAGAELARVEERLEQLQVRAGVDGRLVLGKAQDLPGRFVKQGSLLAHIVTDAPSVVRIAIPQEGAAPQAVSSRSVGVRLANDPFTRYHGTIDLDQAASVAQLPSAALGERSGGDLAVDPKDERGLATPQGVLVADVQLDVRLGERVGERAWVRIDHGHAPLAWQAARALQQLFLSHFNPAQ